MSTGPFGSPRLDIAHVLFMDIVSYSRLPMDRQTRVLQQLYNVVRGTEEFRRAEAAQQLIRLPTGDGMALVFFGDPESALRCALEVSRALLDMPSLPLRMGVHSGAVYRMDDINTSANVAGGGINTAQRVMDCGDAGAPPRPPALPTAADGDDLRAADRLPTAAAFASDAAAPSVSTAALSTSTAAAHHDAHHDDDRAASVRRAYGREAAPRGAALQAEREAGRAGLEVSRRRVDAARLQRLHR